MSRYPAIIDRMKIHTYFKDPRCWCFLSAIIAEYLMEEYPGELTYRRISPLPPARSGNIIVSKTYAKSDVLSTFFQCCREYLDEHPCLTGLLPDSV